MKKAPDVASLLPHEMPMLLVDKMIDVAEKSVHCQVEISADNLFFDKQLNAVPAWVGVEFMAQTVGVWAGYHAWLAGKPVPIGFLLGGRRYSSKFSCFSQGEILDIYGEQLMENDGMSAFACRIECAGKKVASAQLNAFVPSQEKLKEMFRRNNHD